MASISAKWIGVTLLICCLLISCASPSSTSPRSKPGSPLKTAYISPDKKLELRFNLGVPSTYKLVDSPNGTILATAESAIRPDDVINNAFRGTVDVVFSTDSDAVCIQENVSDAIPSIRYILIQKEYIPRTVTYLHPEANTLTTNPVYEFQYVMPDVVGLSKDTIQFRYTGFKQVRPVWINSIHFTESPSTSN